MKKWISAASAILFSYILTAQEVANEVTSSIGEGEFFTVKTKWTMVYIFSGILILIVLRTFRNKPEV